MLKMRGSAAAGGNGENHQNIMALLVAERNEKKICEGGICVINGPGGI